MPACDARLAHTGFGLTLNMNDIFRNSENYETSISEYLTSTVRQASIEAGGVHGRCVDCNRKLSDQHSTLIGRGPICRSHLSLRYTMIPDVWGIDEPEAGPQYTTLDGLEESLEIDFVVVCGMNKYSIFKRADFSPFNWINLEIEGNLDDFLRLSLLDEHEYVQHNLMTCEGDEQAKDFNSWNRLLLLSRLNCGMNPRRGEIVPRRFLLQEMADYPVCEKHMESWHDDIENIRAYGGEATENVPAHLRAIWHNCEECNFVKVRDERVYLGELGMDLLLTGDRRGSDLDSTNPYMPRELDGFANTWNNARVICGYYTKPQITWMNYYTERDSEYWEDWVDSEYSRYAWETGERPHPGIGDLCGVIDYGDREENHYEQAIWDFIAASIYHELDIPDHQGIDDYWYAGYLPSVAGTGLPDEAGHNIVPAPKDPEWKAKMDAWYREIKAKSRGYLKGWQQLPLIQWIAPNLATAGEATYARPTIGLDGRIMDKCRYTVMDAYDCEFGAAERASEGDTPYEMDYSQQLKEVVNRIVQTKAKEKGNVQTTTPSSN